MASGEISSSTSSPTPELETVSIPSSSWCCSSSAVLTRTSMRFSSSSDRRACRRARRRYQWRGGTSNPPTRGRTSARCPRADDAPSGCAARTSSHGFDGPESTASPTICAESVVARGSFRLATSVGNTSMRLTRYGRLPGRIPLPAGYLIISGTNSCSFQMRPCRIRAHLHLRFGRATAASACPRPQSSRNCRWSRFGEIAPWCPRTSAWWALG